MDIKTILNMTSKDIAKLGRNELAKVVSQLASAGNKRLKRLEQVSMGTQSRAYTSAMEVGKFSVKGKNQGQLQNEFKRVSTFLKSKTSTVSGWKSERKKVIKRIGGDFECEESEKNFWKAYRELSKNERALHNSYGSSETQRYLRSEMYNDKPLSESEKSDFKNLFPDDDRKLSHINRVDKSIIRTMVAMAKDYEQREIEFNGDEMSDFFS